MEGTHTVSSTVVLNNTVTVEKDTTLTLSGDGTIKRGSSCTGAMIKVKGGGKLVIEGSVTLDGNAGEAVTKAVIQVARGGRVEMKGGMICNNKAAYGGGVNNEGTFIMTGGTICNNKAIKTSDTSAGTGSGIRNLGTLTIEDGTISGNYAEDGGAGVFNKRGQLTMTGGTITGNTGVERGGGIAHRNGVFNIKGNPQIYNNYRGEPNNQTIDNVELISSTGEKDQEIAISNITIIGKMEENANVGVRVWPDLTAQSDLDKENDCHTYIKFGDAYDANNTDLTFFHVDNGDKLFFKLDSEEVILAMSSGEQEPTYYPLTISVNDAKLGNVDNGSMQVLAGSKITVDGNTITVNGQTVTATPAAEDDRYTYAFSAWKDGQGNEISDDLEMNASMTIVAYFTKTEKTATGPEPAAPEQPTPAPVPAHSGVIRRFPAKTEAESGTEVDSAKTFDGGVAVYAALALVSAGGMMLMRRKRED